MKHLIPILLNLVALWIAITATYDMFAKVIAVILLTIILIILVLYAIVQLVDYRKL